MKKEQVYSSVRLTRKTHAKLKKFAGERLITISKAVELLLK